VSETEYEPTNGPEGELATGEPLYVPQRNPYIPECAFCRRQVTPLTYCVVPRKAEDRAPHKALACYDCTVRLLSQTLALLAHASEPALRAWHHQHLPELVPAKERKAMQDALATPTGGHPRARKSRG
jgi:hypothetical protein